MTADMLPRMTLLMDMVLYMSYADHIAVQCLPQALRLTLFPPQPPSFSHFLLLVRPPCFRPEHCSARRGWGQLMRMLMAISMAGICIAGPRLV